MATLENEDGPRVRIPEKAVILCSQLILIKVVGCSWNDNGKPMNYVHMYVEITLWNTSLHLCRNANHFFILQFEVFALFMNLTPLDYVLKLYGQEGVTIKQE